MFDHPGDDDRRERELPVLQPKNGGVAAGLGRRLDGHPVVAFLLVTFVGFVLLAATSVAVGWLLKTYVLPSEGIGRADERVNIWLAAHRSPGLTTTSAILSGIGDVYAIPALVIISTAGMLVGRRWRAGGAFIVTAIGAEAATYRVATSLIHRQRPNVPRLDQLPAEASYYSGHTAASVAVYVGLALLLTSRIRSVAARRACWIVAIAIPLLVGLSRMYRGMHHPTDVAAGTLVGIGAVLVALTAARAAGAANPGHSEARA